MNERLKELAEQAGLDAKEIRDDESLTLYALEEFDIEKFADLVRQDEREACVKLLDDFTKTKMVSVKDTWRMGVMAAANAVRDKK